MNSTGSLQTEVLLKEFPSLANAAVEVWTGGGQFHVASVVLCQTGLDMGLGRPLWGSVLPHLAPRASISVAEALRSCPNCLSAARADAFSSSAAWEGAGTVLDTALRAKTIRKVTKATSASALASRRKELRKLLAQVEVTAAAPDVSVAARAGDVLELLLQARDALDSLARDPETVEKVKSKVKELMVPKRFVGRIELDETPHLIGISELPWRVKTQVQAAIDAFSIRDDESATVLLAPAYVYAFLLQQLFASPGALTLVVGYPAPEDPAVCEVAAGIWDPEGKSSQACMKTSIEAAHALV